MYVVNRVAIYRKFELNTQIRMHFKFAHVLKLLKKNSCYGPHYLTWATLALYRRHGRNQRERRSHKLNVFTARTVTSDKSILCKSDSHVTRLRLRVTEVSSKCREWTTSSIIHHSWNPSVWYVAHSLSVELVPVRVAMHSSWSSWKNSCMSACVVMHLHVECKHSLRLTPGWCSIPLVTTSQFLVV